MGYLHIPNLYRPEGQYVLLFRECYALEKIHGTSAHLTLRHNGEKIEVIYFSGGTKFETFKGLFNETDLVAKFQLMGLPVDKELTIYGESYGGKEQGMSSTYGKVAKFIVFDVQIGDCWLDVPKAEKVALDLGLEFVYYTKVPTELKELDLQRDNPSVQAVRNGVSTAEDFTLGKGPKREGIVLRPTIEVTLNNGDRVIAKHKGDDFKETKSPRPVVDASKLQVLENAQSVADEWVTPMRLNHVLQKIPGHDITMMKTIIGAMVEDVMREGSGEFEDTPTVRKAISSKTAIVYKQYLNSQISVN